MIRSDNARGALFMIAAMAAFAVEDAAIKAASTHLPLGQVLIAFGALGALAFNIYARAKDLPLYSAQALSPLMALRGVFEVAGRLFYCLAIVLIPLSHATVILQATPVVVVAVAALFLGEQVGLRRWGAVALGFLGVLVTVQPGAEEFTALSLLAVAGMLGFAGRDLISRAVPASMPISVLGFYGFVAITVAGFILLGWTGDAMGRVTAASALPILIAAAAGVLAYVCLMHAMRTGEVSAVTPLRYTRLLFGVALGVLLFGETLEASTLLGGVLILLSGLILTRRRA
ncbi:MAG: DMT family transporter [Pseudomonadota bacterium]